MSRSGDLTIDWIGGNCPVQAEGEINGKPFYFRARGSVWSLEVGGALPGGDGEWQYVERYGEWPAAGWMTEDEARRFIAEGAARYRVEVACLPPADPGPANGE